jgi:hypothetical protein
MKPLARTKKYSTPAVSCSLQKFVGRVLTKVKGLVDDNTAEEVFSDKWQYEYLVSKSEHHGRGVCERHSGLKEYRF